MDDFEVLFKNKITILEKFLFWKIIFFLICSIDMQNGDRMSLQRNSFFLFLKYILLGVGWVVRRFVPIYFIKLE